MNKENGSPIQRWKYWSFTKALESISYEHLCFNVAWVEVWALLVKAVRVNPENPFSRPKPIIWIGSWMVCCTTWDIEYPAHPTYQQVPSQTFALVATELLCRKGATSFRSAKTSVLPSVGPSARLWARISPSPPLLLLLSHHSHLLRSLLATGSSWQNRGGAKLAKNKFFKKWSEMARHLVKAFFKHHYTWG